MLLSAPFQNEPVREGCVRIESGGSVSQTLDSGKHVSGNDRTPDV